MNEYYTYAYLREDRTPYYIGKGKSDRAYRRSRKDIQPPKDKNRIIFLKINLTEEQAFNHEIYMIAVFGRKDLGTGILHNRTEPVDTKPQQPQRTEPVDTKPQQPVEKTPEQPIPQSQPETPEQKKRKRERTEAERSDMRRRMDSAGQAQGLPEYA